MGIAPKLFTRRDWLAWIFTCGIGEALGVFVAAGMDVLLRETFGRSVFQVHGALALLILIGVGEPKGILLGHFQARVLVRHYPGLRRGRWLRLTAWAGGLSWFMGTLPMITFAIHVLLRVDLPISLLPLTAVLAGIFLGGIFGIFQWLEIRHHARHGLYWILANVLAWPPAVGLMYGSAAAAGPVTTWFALAHGAAGFAAGAVLGAVSGLFLFRMQSCEPEERGCA